MRTASITTVCLLSACSVDLDVPRGASIRCASDADCPTDTRCLAEAAVCVLPHSGDTTAPDFAEPPRLSPALAAAGTRLALDFVVDEPLAAPPEVLLGDTAALTVVASGDASERPRFSATYVVSGAEPEGLLALSVRLVDWVGNRVTRTAATATLDFTPPSIVSLVEAGAGEVTLLFSEPVLESDAAQTRLYAIAPALEVHLAVPSDDGTSVTLSTGPQRGGTTYEVTATGIRDLAGNAGAPSTVSFTGVGVVPDPRPPLLLSPASGERAFDLTAVLAWSGRTGVSRYFIEVAEDMPGLADDEVFAAPVPESPFAVDAPQTALAITLPAPLTYRWRVRSDLMPEDEHGETRALEAMDSVIHVFCPASEASCTDTGRAGNRSKPYGSIMTALADAARHDSITAVRVAARGGEAAYEEAVRLVPGVDLLGGYTQSFSEAERDPAAHATVIASSAPTTVSALDIHVPTLLEGFMVRSRAALDADAYGLFVRGSDASLQVKRCTVEGPAARAHGSFAAYVTEGGQTAEDGPRFDACTLQGGPTTEVNAPSLGLYVARGGVTVVSSTVAPGAASWMYGLHAESASVRVEDSDILVAAAAPDTTALAALRVDDSEVMVIGGRIDASGATGGGLVGRQAVWCYGSQLVMDEVLVASPDRGKGPTYGVHAQGGCGLQLNRVVVTSGALGPPGNTTALMTAALRLDGAGDVLVEDSQLDGGAVTAGRATTAGIWLGSAGMVQLLGNVIRGDDASSADGKTFSYGVYVNVAGQLLMSENVIASGRVEGLAGSDSAGVKCMDTPLLRMHNNVVRAGAALSGASSGVFVSDDPASLVNNTIIATGESTTATALALFDATSVVVNNLVLTTAGPAQRYGLAGKAHVLRNNLVFNVAPGANTWLYDASSGADVDDDVADSDIDAALAGVATVVGENLTYVVPVLQLEAVFTDPLALTSDPWDDFVLSGAGLAQNGGLNVYANPVYGTVTTDILGQPRPACMTPPCELASPAWDIGAHEQ